LELKDWLHSISEVRLAQHKAAQFKQFNPKDVFVGYHDDAPASVVLRLASQSASKDEILHNAKRIFMECATPDAFSRLSETK